MRNLDKLSPTQQFLVEEYINTLLSSMSRAKFKEGDKVVITSYGTVESVFEGEGECQYSVTLKGGYSTLYGVKERDIRKK